MKVNLKTANLMAKGNFTTEKENLSMKANFSITAMILRNNSPDVFKLNLITDHMKPEVINLKL